MSRHWGRSSVTEILQNLQWTSLQHRTNTSHITLLYKIVNDQVVVNKSQPTPLTSPHSFQTPHHQLPTTVCLPQNHQGMEQSPSKCCTQLMLFRLNLPLYSSRLLSNLVFNCHCTHFHPKCYLFCFFRLSALPREQCPSC